MRQKLYSITMDELILLRETLNSSLTKITFGNEDKMLKGNLETSLDVIKMILADGRPTIGTSVN